jgi:hypothetical protein
MTVQLPKGIDEYFAADRSSSADSVADCFTESAVVKDEGNAYAGREAIRRWKAESSRKYEYTVEPFSVVTEAGRTVVTSHLVGSFPGSPVDLRYFFALEGDKIAELEIVP